MNQSMFKSMQVGKLPNYEMVEVSVCWFLVGPIYKY